MSNMTIVLPTNTESEQSNFGKSDFGLIITGMCSGAAIRLNSLAGNEEKAALTAFSIAGVAIAAIAMAPTLVLLRKIIRGSVAKALASTTALRRYQRFDTYTYLVCLAPALGAFGIQFVAPLVCLLAFLFIISQTLLVAAVSHSDSCNDVFTSFTWLAFLFLISGFAAILYQIVWQRVLFTVFGVNIESITIIVSIFMFGLGLGSLVGGLLSKLFPDRLPQLFFIIEFQIGAFGLISLYLIKSVSARIIDSSLATISIATFSLLCVPTVLMGATLPILVDYLHRRYKNVGQTIGLLYSFNTLGSAAACFATIMISFVYFGLQGTIYFAAVCNFVVGILVYRYCQQVSSFDGEAGGTKPASPSCETM